VLDVGLSRRPSCGGQADPPPATRVRVKTVGGMETSSWLCYDSKPETRAFWIGRLPHWDVPNRPVFLTIHVRGAIPPSAARRIRALAEQLSDRGATDFTRRLKLVFRNMEAWLDRGDEGPRLTDAAVAASLQDAIAQRAQRGWWRPMEWVIMPNHLHVLYVPGAVGMKRLVEDFKQWTGRQASRLLGLTGQRFWQEEWFDHWSRSSEETERIRQYIRTNPVRAGLASDSTRWRWRSSAV
jgi:putative transposase